MGLLDNIKEGLLQATGKVTDATENMVEKSRKVGAEGFEATRDIFTRIGEKTSDVTSLAKLKHELFYFPKQLDAEAYRLGWVVWSLRRKGEFSPDSDQFRQQLEKFEELDNAYQKTLQDYEAIKKKHSSDYMVEKLSEDLAAADAIIDAVVISDQSNVVNKLLKEILLPKEALVSAVKREEEVIIPDGNTMLKAGDQVIVIGKTDDVQKLVKRFAASESHS